MLDWDAHLKHLQSILLEYNLVGASIKPTILRYFREGLKLFVLAELEHQDLKLESFDQMVKKAVNAEAKSALRLRSSIKKIDQHCSQGNQPANSSVAKSQGSAMKDPWTEEPKVQDIESLSGLKRSEFSTKARKEKKKKQQQKDRARWKGSILATGVNTAQTKEPHQKKKKKHYSDKPSRDTSQIKCYNCQKMGHYATTCPKPKD